jgi:small-conductance mechanosensitive channel
MEPVPAADPGAPAAPEASAERRWAPRLGRMLVFTALMVVSPNLLQPIVFDLDEGARAASMLGVLALAVLFGVLAHRDYVTARNAVRADPSLRGGWLVENAWWVVGLAFVVPVVVGFATALWLLPRLS